MQPDPDSKKGNARFLGWSVLLAAGLLAWLLLLLSGGDTPRAWRALLINFIYVTPLAAGLVTWSAIVIAANGRWAGQAERLTWTGIGFLVPSFLILFGLWIGSPTWAPWYNKVFHQGVWLNNTFVFLRVLIGLLLFWGTAVWFLRARFRGRTRAGVPAAVLVVVYSVVFTMFSFDLVMALSPEWHSAIFGGHFFISSLYLAIVFWTLMVVVQPDSPVEVRHDLGKLVLAFGILTTSLLYMQLLTIWYENFPDETSYLIQRMHWSDWRIVSSVIVFVVYLGPLVMLLTEWSKRNRVFLGAVSVLLLIGLWLERWWMVAPTFAREARLGLVELAAAAAMVGALGLSIELCRSKLPQVPQEGADHGQA